MKKIIIALAVVVTAAIVQASSVKWSLSGMTDIGGNNVGASEGKYTATVTFYDSTGNTVLGTSESTTTTSLNGMSATWTGADLNKSYYAAVVVTDASGNSISSEKAQFSTTSSATYNLNFSSGKGFATQSAKIDFSSGWQAAPEPTSGLLLLLGVAGLALKRKRA